MPEQTVVITGALTGIGQACARRFARKGFNVVVSGRHPQRGKELEAELCSIHPGCRFFLTDVTCEAQVASLTRRAVEIYGSIDVLLNVAGTEGQPAVYDRSDIEDFHRVFDTNVLGTLLVMKYVLPVMCKQRSGSLVNFSSLSGQVGIPGSSVYAASKHAVNGLTRAIALEVAADGVRVNAIAPGPAGTAIFERFTGHNKAVRAKFSGRMSTGRIVTTEEIAATAVFLASDSARSIIGQIITVDGGGFGGISQSRF